MHLTHYYQWGYYVSVYEEARARKIDINDIEALEELDYEVTQNIVTNPVITNSSILQSSCMAIPGPNDPPEYYGFLVSFGRGLDKKKQSLLKQEELEGVKDAIKGALKGEFQDQLMLMKLQVHC
ncbi:hypothetical protein RhiJN_05863 [Ceratobasidium sp. AG-Ba]|nr:hypothetical protein RhiJN_05863 [Ceratobasidium sp. AG-Ba]QRW06792.1 hypothetical protein RhiLY_05791 [Ceratobasidium sp. AG-Ba]